MTTQVSFKLAKLLKEKGFDNYHEGTICSGYSGKKIEENIILSPTIAEVVMWLHNKHNIWISVYKYKDHAADVNDNIVFRGHYTKFKDFNSPTEAYEAAINYVLTKLI